MRKITTRARRIANSKINYELPYRVRNTVTTDKMRNTSKKTHLQSITFSANNHRFDETDTHLPE